MTFKSIVIGMIERDSQKWIEKLLDRFGIEYKWVTVSAGAVTLEKDTVGYVYSCKARVTLERYNYADIEVGGAVDNMGMYHSVIWDAKHQIIWMAVEKTREALGITEFKVA